MNTTRNVLTLDDLTIAVGNARHIFAGALGTPVAGVVLAGGLTIRPGELLGDEPDRQIALNLMLRGCAR